MESRANVIAAGLFVITLTIGLIVAALWLTSDSIDRLPYLVVSKVPVTGLHAKAAVRLRGVDVGRVDAIAFDPQNPRTILINISVDRAAGLTQGTYSQLAFQGVTGLSYIALDDDGDKAAALVTSNGAPGRIEMRRSLIDNIGESSADLLRDASQAAKRVNRLLSDENLAHFSGTLKSTEAAAVQLATLAANLQPVSRSVQGLATDTRGAVQKLDVLLGDLQGTTVEFTRHMGALDQVGRGAQAIGDASTALQATLVDDTLPRLSQAADDLSRTSRTLDRFLSQMQERPQSLVLGAPAPAPGPGEAGFATPAGERQ
jgi:phospholipid/cholesterol/gamma-HCH transport system substrate-binding protein